MSIQPTFLITDLLFFALTIGLIAFVFVVRKRPHLSRPWSQVLKSTTGSVSLMILLFYYAIALVDSVHFHPRVAQATESQYQYSSEVHSLLDVLMTPMRSRMEKTFSAPLATHSFAKEMMQNEAGQLQRDYPRLNYGGAHLAQPEDQKAADIISISLQASAQALFYWALIWLFMLWLYSQRNNQGLATLLANVLKAKTTYPLRAIAITSAVLMLLIVVSMQLGQHYHLFGTDKVGQDVFYQAVKSVRTGILIGVLTTLITLPLAILLGALAGFFRGWVDDVIQYIYTTLNSIPHVLLIAAAVLLLQVYMSGHADDFDSLTERADLRLLFLCLILGITSWTGLCRLLRAETFKLREMEYIQAAEAFGVSKFKILMRHVMPNFMHIVIISVVLDFSGLVLAEAVLSYINIGVDPSMNSWGNMINQARLEMARDPIVWWSLSAAFVFMFTLVLFANLFADVVRDALDPRVVRGEQ